MMIEQLETRRLLTILMVTDARDSGPGTLRDMVEQANNSPGQDVIRFAFSPQQRDTIFVQRPIEVTDALLIDGPGADALVLDGFGYSSIFEVAPDSPGMTIENLTFRNAAGGAAIVVQSGASLLVRDAVFEGNNDAAIVSDASPVLVQSSTFQGNDGGLGGAISVTDATLRVEGSVFTENSAGWGGAIYANQEVFISDSAFVANHAQLRGGAVSVADTDDDDGVTPRLSIADSSFDQDTTQNGLGSAIYAIGETTIAGSTIQNSSTIEPSFPIGTGAIVLFGAGDDVAPLPDLVIRDTTIANNTGARSAGLLASSASSLRIENSRFTENTAVGSNGGGFTAGNIGYVEVINTEVTGNRSEFGRGGGAWLQDNGQVNIVQSTFAGNISGLGGALYIDSFNEPTPIDEPISVSIVQSTITQNHATASTGGIAVLPAFGTDLPANSIDILIANSILSGNTAEFTSPYGVDYGVLVPLAPSDEPNGEVNLTLVGPNLLGSQFEGDPDAGEAVITDDPQLLPLDFYGGVTRTLPPTLNSPARDAGDDALAVNPGPDNLFSTGDDTPLVTDQSQTLPRTIYGRVDLGAAEAVLTGDANFDGTVDLADFLILRGSFGNAGSVFADGDFNGDGEVDLADFLLLRGNFGVSINDA